jgi:hypothetical protein
VTVGRNATLTFEVSYLRIDSCGNDIVVRELPVDDYLLLGAVTKQRLVKCVRGRGRSVVRSIVRELVREF